jgi:ParB family chromosome partitioning protein
MIQNVPLTSLFPNPWQVRLGEPDPEYIKELALDIASNGLLQIPIGRSILDGEIQLAFGHNRLAAYRYIVDIQPNSNILGDWSFMPVDVRPLSDEQMANYAWSENEKRRNLNPLERAMAMQKRIDSFAWSHDQVAEHLGLSRSTVSNALRLLKLPQDILEKLATGTITERQAMALMPLYDLPADFLECIENSSYWEKPSLIVRAVLNNQISSDLAREQIDRMRQRSTRKLDIWSPDTKKPFEGIQGLQSLDCNDCPSRDKKNCLNPVCFEKKKKAWAKFRLDLASQASGIFPLDPDSSCHSDFHYGDIELLPVILKSKCPNLRLSWENDERNSKLRSLVELGYRDVEVVCSKRQGFCSCLNGAKVLADQKSENEKQSKAQVDSDQAQQDYPNGHNLIEVFETTDSPVNSKVDEIVASSDDLQEAAKQQRRTERDIAKRIDEFRHEASLRVSNALANNHLGAWKMLARKFTYYVCSDSNDKADIGDIQLKVAERLIGNRFAGQKASAYIEGVNESLRRTGLPTVDILNLNEEVIE